MYGKRRPRGDHKSEGHVLLSRTKRLNRELVPKVAKFDLVRRTSGHIIERPWYPRGTISLSENVVVDALVGVKRVVQIRKSVYVKIVYMYMFVYVFRNKLSANALGRLQPRISKKAAV